MRWLPLVIPEWSASFRMCPELMRLAWWWKARSEKVAVGDKVIVTGFELGAGRWGGYAEFIRVPAEWVVPLPEGLTSAREHDFGHGRSHRSDVSGSDRTSADSVPAMAKLR